MVGCVGWRARQGTRGQCGAGGGERSGESGEAAELTAGGAGMSCTGNAEVCEPGREAFRCMSALRQRIWRCVIFVHRRSVFALRHVRVSAHVCLSIRYVRVRPSPVCVRWTQCLLSLHVALMLSCGMWGVGSCPPTIPRKTRSGRTLSGFMNERAVSCGRRPQNSRLTMRMRLARMSLGATRTCTSYHGMSQPGACLHEYTPCPAPPDSSLPLTKEKTQSYNAKLGKVCRL